MYHTDTENIDLSLQERVNPVFHTARMALSGLAMAGDRDAAVISEKLNINSDWTSDVTTVANARDPLNDIQDLANSVFLEMRFRTVGTMAVNSDCAVIVDLPCGYTPRGLQMTKMNKRYIGLDLPATIHDLEREIMPLVEVEKQSLIRYAAVDATNFQSLETALKGVQGPVCITTEGLLMYLNDYECAELCDNIRRLLEQYGGCWITSDPEMMIQNTSVMRTIAGDRYQEVMNRLMQGFESKADIHVEDPVMMIQPWKNGGKDILSDTEKALSFLSAKGLKAERLAVGRYMPEINSLSYLKPEIAEAVRAGMEQCAYWKITLESGKTEEIRSESFSVQAELAEGKLNLSLCGRVDTLTAPHVLELYEKISKGTVITEIVVDCAKLQYISSAGLRVLLIMQKKHPVKMQAVNKYIREILEATGFDTTVDVEKT